MLLPLLLRWGPNFEKFGAEQYNTAIACAVAALFGLVALRQLTAFPQTNETVYLAPIMGICYAIVLTSIAAFRVQFELTAFGSSFALTLLWTLATYALSEKPGRNRFAVVPGGDIERLRPSSRMDLMLLDCPSLPSGHFDGLVVDLRANLGTEWERFITECAVSGVRVVHVKQLQEAITGRVEIDHLSENTLGSINPDALYLKAKVGADWILALVALIIMLPLAVAITIAVKLDSPGPVIFRQKRVGFRGKSFTIYKFRTMAADAPEQGDREAAMTLAGDVRITRLGRFLRKSRLDELPQLLNILRGEMSWIGPRPEAAVLSQWYEEELPYYRYRHIVRPGISGWAQISQGHVTDVSLVHEKLHYDFYYIKHFSVWLDLLITLRTFGIIITGFGAR